MCKYCVKRTELEAKHAAIVEDLDALEGGSYAQREALTAQATIIHRQIEANSEAGDADKAACDVWRATA